MNQKTTPDILDKNERKIISGMPRRKLALALCRLAGVADAITQANSKRVKGHHATEISVETYHPRRASNIFGRVPAPMIPMSVVLCSKPSEEDGVIPVFFWALPGDAETQEERVNFYGFLRAVANTPPSKRFICIQRMKQTAFGKEMFVTCCAPCGYMTAVSESLARDIMRDSPHPAWAFPAEMGERGIMETLEPTQPVKGFSFRNRWAREDDDPEKFAEVVKRYHEGQKEKAELDEKIRNFELKRV